MRAGGAESLQSNACHLSPPSRFFMTRTPTPTYPPPHPLQEERARKYAQEVQSLQFNVLVTTYEFIMRDRTKLSKVGGMVCSCVCMCMFVCLSFLCWGVGRVCVYWGLSM